MKDCTFKSCAAVAACLLLVVAANAATPDTAIEPTPSAAAKPAVGPKLPKATRHAVAAKPAVATKPEAVPAAAQSGASGPLSAEQSAALAQQRLRRCQLHPGTCVQGSGGAPPLNSPSSAGKGATEQPGTSDGHRD